VIGVAAKPPKRVIRGRQVRVEKKLVEVYRDGKGTRNAGI
jgi:hypothetical protein